MTNKLCEELHHYGILAFIIISIIVAKYRRRRYPLILYLTNTLLYGGFYFKKCGHVKEHGKYRSHVEEYRDHDISNLFPNSDHQRQNEQLPQSLNDADTPINLNSNNNNLIKTANNPNNNFKIIDQYGNIIDTRNSSKYVFNSFAEIQLFMQQNNNNIKSSDLSVQQSSNHDENKHDTKTINSDNNYDHPVKSSNQPSDTDQANVQSYLENDLGLDQDEIDHILSVLPPDDDVLVNSYTPHSYLKLHNANHLKIYNKHKKILELEVPHWKICRDNLVFLDLQVNKREGITPNEILRDKKKVRTLEKYEIAELKSKKYDQVWFTGKVNTQKIIYNSSQPNNGFDEEGDEDGNRGGSYKIVPGDHINYRYEILKFISAGVYGQVLLVDDHAKHGRKEDILYGDSEYKSIKENQMALKVMNNHTSLRSRLGLEYYAVRYIHRHIEKEEKPFVVGAHGVDSFRNHQIFVYELLGESMWARHHRQKVRGDLLKKIAWDLLEGLNVLDRIELVHNDLKPDNILFTGEEYPYVKIIDYWSRELKGYKFW